MTVELDAGAKAMLKLFDNFDSFNDELIDNITDELTGSGAGGIITKRFERKVGRQRTYEPLKDSTKKKKANAKPAQKHVMVASGKTKEDTLKTMRGKNKRGKIEFTAKVPGYAKLNNDGRENVTQRQFFSFNGPNGRPQSADVNTFNKVGETQFNKLLAKKGLT